MGHVQFGTRRARAVIEVSLKRFRGDDDGV